MKRFKQTQIPKLTEMTESGNIKKDYSKSVKNINIKNIKVNANQFKVVSNLNRENVDL